MAIIFKNEAQQAAENSSDDDIDDDVKTENEAEQAAENSSDDDIDDDVKTENEAESKPSLFIENLKRHEAYENLELLGEVYHIVNGGEKRSLNSCLLQKSPLGNTILHIAAWYGNNEVVDQVVKLAPHLLFEFNSNEDSALHVAARAGNISTLEKLLMAYTSKRVEVASEWIKYLSDEDDIDLEDVSPKEFSEDVKSQSFGLIKFIGVKNKQGNMVLHEAMMSSNNSMATMIFQILEPYKKEDYKGRSLSKCCYEFALNEENKANQSVLYLAVEAGHKEAVIQILDKCHEDVMPKGTLPLLPAIIKKDKGLLSTILFKKQDWIHLMDTQDRLPLHYTASLGYFEGVVDLLEKCNTCIIQRDIYGYFPIHLASREGHVDVVKKLLEYCPDPMEMLDNYGRNVLHIAAKSGMLYVVRYILQTRALEKLINQKDKDENTPLHLAARKCHPKIVYALTWDHRVDLDMVNQYKQTPLDITNAIYQSEKENPSLRQRLTWTALKSASAKRSPSKMLTVAQSNSKSNKNSQKTEQSKEKVSQTEPLKDRVQTLMLVSTLIITASVAACFSVPGEAEGNAHNLNHAMFQFFIFCITISLFSSISATIVLFWAQLGEIRLLAHTLELTMPLLGIALVSLSLAFLGGVYSVISKLTWLASTFVVITVIFVLIVLFLYILLFLPSPSTNKALRYMSYYPFIYLASLAENHHTHKF